MRRAPTLFQAVTILFCLSQHISCCDPGDDEDEDNEDNEDEDDDQSSLDALEDDLDDMLED